MQKIKNFLKDILKKIFVVRIWRSFFDGDTRIAVVMFDKIEFVRYKVKPYAIIDVTGEQYDTNRF